jgi:hypothetical protein
MAENTTELGSARPRRYGPRYTAHGDGLGHFPKLDVGARDWTNTPEERQAARIAVAGSDYVTDAAVAAELLDALGLLVP